MCVCVCVEHCLYVPSCVECAELTHEKREKRLLQNLQSKVGVVYLEDTMLHVFIAGLALRLNVSLQIHAYCGAGCKGAKVV